MRRPALIPATPPPGPFRPGFWRSPLRSTWLTSILGSMLLILLTPVALTGLISHAGYHPGLGHNATVPPSGDIGPLITLPAGSPAWLYALSQGIHVNLGLAAIPILLAKLWSVIPRLFAWPPVRSPAQVLERASLLLLVGGGLFEFATGVMNIQLFYPWHFGFVRAHYYGAWIFIAALILHIAVKLPTVRRAYRQHGVLRPLREDLARTRPHASAEDELVSPRPAAPTLSRRGLLGLAGASSFTLLLVNVGESIGGPFRRLALLAPRGRDFGSGPNDFQINKTAVAVGVEQRAANPGWRLVVRGQRTVSLSRAQLLSMPQHSYDLPIACVEGWSTTQRWTGVRVRDLAVLAGARSGTALHVESLQTKGPFRQATYAGAQVADERSILALRVNGAQLSLDHGYPARVVMASLPGVHCTKWIATMTFFEA